MSAANQTKHQLGLALKAELATTPIDRVTVAGLAKTCGITRQTFYYHFADVYELAIWVFETDIADHIMAHASYELWADGFLKMLHYMQEHDAQCYAVINTLTTEKLEQFFYYQLRNMMRAIVAELQGERVLVAADRRFIIDHFSLSVLAHLLHWLARGMRDDPRPLVANLEYIMRGSVERALNLFAAPS